MPTIVSASDSSASNTGSAAFQHKRRRAFVEAVCATLAVAIGMGLFAAFCANPQGATPLEAFAVTAAFFSILVGWLLGIAFYSVYGDPDPENLARLKAACVKHREVASLVRDRRDDNGGFITMGDLSDAVLLGDRLDRAPDDFVARL